MQNDCVRGCQLCFNSLLYSWLIMLIMPHDPDWTTPSSACILSRVGSGHSDRRDQNLPNFMPRLISVPETEETEMFFTIIITRNFGPRDWRDRKVVPLITEVSGSVTGRPKCRSVDDRNCGPGDGVDRNFGAVPGTETLFHWCTWARDLDPHSWFIYSYRWRGLSWMHGRRSYLKERLWKGSELR